MKKALLLITTFFFVFSLGGCFLEPDDVKEVSDNYCLDNPDSSTCKGEAVGELDYDTVLNIYETILIEYNNLEKDNFCEEYFSITNIELINSCKTDRAQFFPENFTEYTVEEIVINSSTTTEDVYKIVTLSSDRRIQVTFLMSLTLYEGIMNIKEWSYDVLDLFPTPDLVPFEDAKNYFLKFIEDYLEENITSEVFCLTYHSDLLESECIDKRNEDIINLESITALHFFPTMGGLMFQTIVAVTYFNEDAEVIEENYYFEYDMYGNIVMTVSILKTTFEQLEDFLELYIADFNNIDITDEVLCNTYFDPEYNEICLNDRADAVLHHRFITLNDFFFNDDSDLVAVFTYYNDLESYSVEYSIKFTDINDAPKIKLEIKNAE